MNDASRDLAEVKELLKGVVGTLGDTSNALGKVTLASDAFKKAAKSAGAMVAMQKKNIDQNSDAYKKNREVLENAARQYNLLNKTTGQLGKSKKELTLVAKQLNALAKEETKQIQKLTGEYKGLVKRTMEYVASQTKAALSSAGFTLSVGKLLDVLTEYNNLQFSVVRTSRIFGKGLDDTSDALKYVQKNTVISSRAFMGLVDTFNRGYIGVAKSSMEIAKLGHALQKAFGPNVKEIEQRMQVLLGVANKFPALYKQIETAGMMAQMKGMDSKALERYKAQIVATGMALGLSSEEWDTIAKFTTKATEQEAKLQQAALLRAKAQQTIENVTLRIAQYMDKIIVAVSDWASKHQGIVDGIEKGLEFLTKYPVEIAATVAGIGLMIKGLKVAKDLWDLKQAQKATGGSMTGGVAGRLLGGPQRGSSPTSPMFVHVVNQSGMLENLTRKNSSRSLLGRTTAGRMVSRYGWGAAGKGLWEGTKRFFTGVSTRGEIARAGTGVARTTSRLLGGGRAAQSIGRGLGGATRLARTGLARAGGFVGEGLGLSKLGGAAGGVGKLAGKVAAPLAAAFALFDIAKLATGGKDVAKKWSEGFKGEAENIEKASNPISKSFGYLKIALNGALNPVKAVASAFVEFGKMRDAQKAAKESKKALQDQGKAFREVNEKILKSFRGGLKSGVAWGDKDAAFKAKKMKEIYENQSKMGFEEKDRTVSTEQYNEILKILDPANEEMKQLREEAKKFREEAKQQPGLFLIQRRLAEAKQDMAMMVELMDKLRAASKGTADSLEEMFDVDLANKFGGQMLEATKKKGEEIRKYLGTLFAKDEGIGKLLEESFKGSKVNFDAVLKDMGVTKEQLEKMPLEEISKIVPELGKRLEDEIKKNPITVDTLRQIMPPEIFKKISSEIGGLTGELTPAMLKQQQHMIEELRANKEAEMRKRMPDYEQKVELAGKGDKDAQRDLEEIIQLKEKESAITTSIMELQGMTTARASVQAEVTETIGKGWENVRDAIKETKDLQNREAKVAEEYNAALEQRLQIERDLMESAQFGMGASIEMMQKQVDLEYELMNAQGKRIKNIDVGIKKSLIAAGVSEDQAESVGKQLSNATSLEQRKQILNGLGEAGKKAEKEILIYTQNRDDALARQMQHQKKIYDLTKEMREGYLDAVREMSVGAGEFEKIIGTQEMGITQLMSAVNKFTETGNEGMLNTMKLGGQQSAEMTAAGVGTGLTGQYTTGGGKFINKYDQEQRNKRIWGYQSSMEQYEKMQRGEAKSGQVGTGVAGEVTTDTANAVRDGAFDGVKEGAKEGITEAFKASGIIMVPGSRGSPVGNMPMNPAVSAGGGFNAPGNRGSNPDEVMALGMREAAKATGGRADASTIPLMPRGGFGGEKDYSKPLMRSKGMVFSEKLQGWLPEDSATIKAEEETRAYMAEKQKSANAQAATPKSSYNQDQFLRLASEGGMDTLSAKDFLDRARGAQNKVADAKIQSAQKSKQAKDIRKSLESVHGRKKGETYMQWHDRLANENPKAYSKLKEAEGLEAEVESLKSIAAMSKFGMLDAKGNLVNTDVNSLSKEERVQAQMMRDAWGNVKGKEGEDMRDTLFKKGINSAVTSKDEQGRPIWESISDEQQFKQMRLISAASQMGQTKKGNAMDRVATAEVKAVGYGSEAERKYGVASQTSQATYNKAMSEGGTGGISGLSSDSSGAGGGIAKVIVELSPDLVGRLDSQQGVVAEVAKAASSKRTA